jgi:hypothetical protein
MDFPSRHPALASSRLVDGHRRQGFVPEGVVSVEAGFPSDAVEVAVLSTGSECITKEIHEGHDEFRGVWGAGCAVMRI